MTKNIARRLFGPVMFWTVLTGIFAWLPLVRIVGRPEGYTWGILSLSGSGTDGPFWIFIVSTAYVLAMLFSLQRGPRVPSYFMVVAWHGLLTAVVIAALVLGGSDASWQGQGLRFAIPMWILVVPFALFTTLAAGWAITDHRAHRSGAGRPSTPWSLANTRRLAISLVLLTLALALFRAGTNYDGVTAAAIITTIVHWILLVDSFAPRGVGNGAGAANPPPRPESIAADRGGVARSRHAGRGEGMDTWIEHRT